MTKFLDVLAVTGASTQSTVDENSAQTGYLVVNPTTLTATGTLSATNAFNVLSGSTASQTATLPAAATANQQLIVSNQATVTWTLAPNTGATISGQSSRTLQPNETVVLQANAATPTLWNVISWWGSDNPVVIGSITSLDQIMVKNTGAGFSAFPSGYAGMVQALGGMYIVSDYSLADPQITIAPASIATNALFLKDVPGTGLIAQALSNGGNVTLNDGSGNIAVTAGRIYGYAGLILNAVNYAPTTASTYTTSSTTLGAIDSTNLTITHIAQSTQTKIRATLSVLQSTGLAGLIFGLVNHSTSTQVPNSGIDAVVTPSLTVYDRAVVEILVTGLTVGTSYSWDLAWATKSATDAGDIGVIQSGSNGSYGIATIEAIQA